MQVIKTAIITDKQIGNTLSKLHIYTESDLISSYTEDDSHLIVYADFEHTLDEVITDLKRALNEESEAEWFNTDDEFSMDELLALKGEFAELRAEGLNSMEYKRAGE